MSTAADKPVRHILALSGGKPAPYVRALDMLDPILTRHYPKPIVGGSCGAFQGRDHLQVAFGYTGGQHRSVYFAERMAERLSGIEDVEIEVSHTAKQYWTTSHDSENRDIIFQEELR